MIRLAENNDIQRILIIFNEAIKLFKLNNINQWQNGYPNYETIKLDIEAKKGYVYEENNKILGYCCIDFDKEETYNEIYNGNWKSSNQYATIHRIVVKNNLKRKGIAQCFFDYAFKIAKENNCNLRIDTHKDNIPMKKFIGKNNFEYCGIILLKDKAERLAFELVI